MKHLSLFALSLLLALSARAEYVYELSAGVGTWYINSVSGRITFSGGAEGHHVVIEFRPAGSSSPYVRVRESVNGDQPFAYDMIPGEYQVFVGDYGYYDPWPMYASSYHTVTIGAEPSVYKASVEVHNPATVPVVFRGVHPVDGQIFQITLAPGETFTGTYEVTTDAPIEVQWAVPGVRFADGNVWTSDPGEMSEFMPGGSVTPVQVPQSQNPPAPTTPIAPPTSGPTAPPTTTAPQSGPTPWTGPTNPPPTPTPTNPTPYTGPTATEFREGIGKIENAVGKAASESAVRDSTRNGHLSALNAKLTAMQTAQTAQTAAAQETATASQALLTAINGTADPSPLPDIPVPEPVDLQASSMVSGALSKLPVAPTIELPENNTSFSVEITVPGLAGTQTLAFDVTDYPGVALFRTLCLGGMTVLFFFLVLRAVKEAFA